MTKFKVGDKVRIGLTDRKSFSGGVVQGDILTVSKISSPRYFHQEAFDSPVYTFKENSYFFSDNSAQCEASELADKETIETTFAALNPQTGEFILRPATLEKKFPTENFKKIIDETVHQINELSEKKGGEYSGDDDRLANFRRNANALNLNKEDIWAVYAAKHWDAVMQYIKDGRTGKKRERLESISGRCDDLIVYLLLMKAMIQENGD